MNAIRAELLKLARSLSWVVVLLLPTAMVLSGVANTLASGEDPEHGWHTMWLRSVVVHGMAPLPLGIAIIASLVWRPERQGGNWNTLLSGPTSALRIAAAKTVVIAAIAAAIQIVLLAVLALFGTLVFDLPGLLPAEYLGISALIVVASVPVAAVQSGLSILLPSFAAAVACALVASGTSVVLLLADVGAVIAVLPHALLARTTQLGTGTFADPGTIGFGDVPRGVLGQGRERPRPSREARRRARPDRVRARSDDL